MATKIQISLTTYLVNFAGGQSGLRTPPYTQYATDFDTNFTTLRNTINAIIDEVAAVQGAASAVGIEQAVFNDPTRAGGVATTGRVGADSFRISIGSPTSNLVITGGTFLSSGAPIKNGSGGATMAGSGGAGTRYVAIDINGTIYVETLAGQRLHDVGTATWNGSAYTAVVNYDPTTTPYQAVFFDGDEYERMLVRPVQSPTWTARTHKNFTDRLVAIERLVSGFVSDGVGNAIGPMAVNDGSASLPDFVFRLDTDTGIYRNGNNTFGISNAGSAAVFVDGSGFVDLPKQARVKGARTATQSLATATATFVDFDAADLFDVGTWHDHASGTLSVRESFTCPTDGDGEYLVAAFIDMASPGASMPLLIEVTKNGTAIPEFIQRTVANGESFAGNLVASVSLVATDVLKVRVTQSSGGNVDIEEARFLIQKID